VKQNLTADDADEADERRYGKPGVVMRPEWSSEKGAYWIGLSVSVALFGIMNYVSFSRRVTCWDCFFPFGWPFRLFQQGGFAGGRGIVWPGLAADVFLMFAAGVTFSRVLQWAFRKAPAHES